MTYASGLHFNWRAAVDVVITHDVVFTQVLTALYLDHHQVDDAGVGQAVLVPGGNVGGLVHVEQDLAFAIGDHRCAADHYPMLAAVMVHLQRQRAFGLDHDALDFEPRAFLQHRVGAPRPGDSAVQAERRVILALEFGNDMPHVLAAMGVGDQQGVRGVDDDQVAHAHRTEYPLGRIDVAVMYVVQDRLAIDLVAIVITGRELAQGFPGADIAPANVAGHDRDLGGFFHQ